MLVANSKNAQLIFGNNVFRPYTLGVSNQDAGPIAFNSGGVPCVPRPTGRRLINTSNQTISGVQAAGCRWIWFPNQWGGGHWECVGFGGGGTSAGTLKGYASGDIDPDTGLPYCDAVGIIDQIMYWIQQNPLPAAAAAAGIGFLLYRMLK